MPWSRATPTVEAKDSGTAGGACSSPGEGASAPGLGACSVDGAVATLLLSSSAGSAVWWVFGGQSRPSGSGEGSRLSLASEAGVGSVGSGAVGGAGSSVWREDPGLLSRPCRKRRPSAHEDGGFHSSIFQDLE